MREGVGQVGRKREKKKLERRELITFSGPALGMISLPPHRVQSSGSNNDLMKLRAVIINGFGKGIWRNLAMCLWKGDALGTSDARQFL